jgi:5-oxoprolinase (ATP-hydrolysing) subunit B
MTETPHANLSMLGEAAVLLDAGGSAFEETVQHRILDTARALAAHDHIGDVVPGMNNLLVLFDPFAVPLETIRKIMLAQWEAAQVVPTAGRNVRIPVRYGGDDGDDLAAFAEQVGLSEQEVIARHSAVTYAVAAVGFMPGFVYLSGLDPLLALPRRATPRSRVPAGSVMIGGSQTGILPRQSPTGWHVIGRTDFALFDADASPPAALSPGDRIHFVPSGGGT